MIVFLCSLILSFFYICLGSCDACCNASMCQNGYNIEKVPVQQQQKEHINRKKAPTKVWQQKQQRQEKELKNFHQCNKNNYNNKKLVQQEQQ